MAVHIHLDNGSGGGETPDLSQYQKKLVAGENILIDEATNTISATGGAEQEPMTVSLELRDYGELEFSAAMTLQVATAFQEGRRVVLDPSKAPAPPQPDATEGHDSPEEPAVVGGTSLTRQRYELTELDWMERPSVDPRCAFARVVFGMVGWERDEKSGGYRFKDYGRPQRYVEFGWGSPGDEAAHAAVVIAGGGNWYASGSGVGCVIEGRHNQGASSTCVHIEGKDNIGAGMGSHTEGGNNANSATFAHVEGIGHHVVGKAMHVVGKSSSPDIHLGGESGIGNADPLRPRDYYSDYVEIVGNGGIGGNPARSNARELRWDGNEWLAGTLEVSRDPESDMEVATRRYVDSRKYARVVAIRFASPAYNPTTQRVVDTSPGVEIYPTDAEILMNDSVGRAVGLAGLKVTAQGKEGERQYAVSEDEDIFTWVAVTRTREYSGGDKYEVIADGGAVAFTMFHEDGKWLVANLSTSEFQYIEQP